MINKLQSQNNMFCKLEIFWQNYQFIKCAVRYKSKHLINFQPWMNKTGTHCLQQPEVWRDLTLHIPHQVAVNLHYMLQFSELSWKAGPMNCNACPQLQLVELCLPASCFCFHLTKLARALTASSNCSMKWTRGSKLVNVIISLFGVLNRPRLLWTNRPSLT